MAERDFPDGRMQKLMGKPWCSWNLPEQPTDTDIQKLKEAYLPPEKYRSSDHHSIPIPSQFLPLFGTHPDSDFMSITKCPACGWLLKIQHANKHFLRDSRGAIVCKDSELAIYGSKVLGKAAHPCGELKDSWSRRITLRLVPPAQPTLPVKHYHHSLRGPPAITEMVSKNRSGSHSNVKTDYISNSSSQYRSRSHSQVHVPPSFLPKSRSGSSGSSSHGQLPPAHASSVNKSKSVKTHSSSSTSSWSSSSIRSSSSNNSKVSSGHKTSHGTSGSYTLSIPSEDMGQNESVEDLLISNTSHVYTSSKHVHIIATQNSSKSKSAEKDYDHHVKFYPEEKRIKLDTHSHSHHHKGSHSDSHDSYKSKSRHTSSSHHNGVTSDSIKKSKTLSSSSLAHSKIESSSSSGKHHLRSSAPSTIVTISKPVVSVPSLSSQTRVHGSSHTNTGSSSSHHSDKNRDKDRSSPSKKKKRKRDKDEPRKIIPLKDRDFNPDKHCGVCPAGSHSPCKRSLTCKTHSIALRRAVNGRSKSFDALLAAHKLAKNEEKGPTSKEVPPVEEILPPKPKKKKPSGTSSTTTSSPNELGALASVSERTNYVRARAPDVEVLVVKPKPKPPPTPQIDLVHCYSKKFKNCPLVYPYMPETQAKFEAVWYSPATLDRNTQSAEERHKFVFLLKHYKNPYFINCDIKPLSKNAREKRNVFSIWNASEKQVEASSQHTVNWATTMDGRRQVNDTEDLQYLCLVNKK